MKSGKIAVYLSRWEPLVVELLLRQKLPGRRRDGTAFRQRRGPLVTALQFSRGNWGMITKHLL